MKKYWLPLFFVLGIMQSVSLWANTLPQYDIGVLSFRPADIALKKWQPMADYLNQQIPQANFKITPLNYPQLNEAVKNKTVDFVFTNSASYIRLSHIYNLKYPLASLINQKHGRALKNFGGVIVLPIDSSIKTLSDLKGKTIAAPSKKSFGGFLMQANELFQAGLHAHDYQVNTLGMPHDRSVHAVLKGEADAGFVRTGVLEAMIESGLIKENQFRVLRSETAKAFPLYISTQAYPEWPFIAMQQTPEKIASLVAGVLLGLPHGEALAQKMGIHGFRIPDTYEPVRDVMRNLRVAPYDELPAFTLVDVLNKHALSVIMLSAGVLLIFVLMFMVIRSNKALSKVNVRLKEQETDLKISAACFNAYQPMLITDAKERIIKVNSAFCENTGYSEEELIGQTPKFLSSGEHNAEFYSDMWHDLNTQGFWRGEVWNRKKNGEIFPILQTITAISNEKGDVTHYQSSSYDITSKKQSEEFFKSLAYGDPLTGLANRTLFLDHMERALAFARRNHQYYALLFIDLDNFKPLNDNYGHHIGDLLLKELGDRLKRNTRDIDTVARLGGDEFVILLEGLKTDYDLAQAQAKVITDKIKHAIFEGYRLEGLDYQVSASIGITLFSNTDLTSQELIQQADKAMYEAKTSGKNQIKFSENS